MVAVKRKMMIGLVLWHRAVQRVTHQQAGVSHQLIACRPHLANPIAAAAISQLYTSHWIRAVEIHRNLTCPNSIQDGLKGIPGIQSRSRLQPAQSVAALPDWIGCFPELRANQ